MTDVSETDFSTPAPAAPAQPTASATPVADAVLARVATVAKSKAKPKAAIDRTPGNLVAGLQATLSKRLNTALIPMSDLRSRTWGIKLPHLALQYLVGRSDTLPSQRILRTSGEPKHFKSSFQVYLSTLFVEQGGFAIYGDNEKGKTSATMLEAMKRRLPVEMHERLMLAPCNCAEEWQTLLVDTVKAFRDPKGPYSNCPKGERLPMYIVVDSLNGTPLKNSSEKLEKEGTVEAKGFPELTGQITRFLNNFDMLGTTITCGIVQHLKSDMANEMHESGAKAASFALSVGIRIRKGAVLSMASHPLFPVKGPSIVGHELWMTTDMSCLGPGVNNLMVPILWQYTPDENGVKQQLMQFDWYAALGVLLRDWKYDKYKKLNAFEIKELDSILHFVEGSNSKTVKCEQLGLEDAGATEFGMAIEADPVIREKLSNFMGITKYTSVQDAEIDWTAGTK